VNLDDFDPSSDRYWELRLLILESWSGKWIECDCGAILIRLPGESDYHCHRCGCVM